MNPWALAITAPNAERTAIVELGMKLGEGFPYHHFLQRAKVVRRGRVVERAVPAFPRYLFVPAQLAWQCLQHVTRIVGLVSSPELGLWTVPQAEVDKLLIKVDPQGFLPAPDPQEPFKSGDKVWIKGDVHLLSGHQAVYQSMIGNETCSLLFDWCGKQVPVQVDLRDVELYVERKRTKRRYHRRSSRREAIAKGVSAS
jgi:transcription antitermination factor NusG